MSDLSEEQRRKIEENRIKALALREARRNSQVSSSQLHQNNRYSPYKVPPSPGQNKVNTSLQQGYGVQIQSRQNLFANSNSQHGILTSPGQSTSWGSPQPKQEYLVHSHAPPMSAVCLLHGKQRFYVEMKYHQESINVFKTLPSKHYDTVEKRWDFSFEDHDRLCEAMKQVPKVNFKPLPPFLLNVFSKYPDMRDVSLEGLDTYLEESLMPFQKKGVEFGIQREGRILIADDMGLGKTIQAIGIAQYYKEEWPVVVVCPASMRYDWREAFLKWVSYIVPRDICVWDGGSHNMDDDEMSVLICSYDLMSRHHADLKTKLNPKILIFDESHYLKTKRSARSKAAHKLAKNAKRVILLTGTPALSKPIELYSQISLVDKKLFPTALDFGTRYCGGKKNLWDRDYSGSSNTKELQLVLEETIMIRRIKSDILTELPQKHRQMVCLDPSFVNTSNKVLRKMDFNLKNNKDLDGRQRRSRLMEYYRETGISKMPAVCAYIRELVQSGRKFLCFAHHKIMMSGIAMVLEKLKCKFVKIDGSTAAKTRKKHCETFMNKEDCKVALLSITAASTGITLTAANLVVFAELFWNPGVLTQAEDRAHRIGQRQQVTAQYLMAKDTADDIIWPLILKKLQFLNAAGLCRENFSNMETTYVDLGEPEEDDLFEEICEIWDDDEDDMDISFFDALSILNELSNNYHHKIGEEWTSGIGLTLEISTTTINDAELTIEDLFSRPITTIAKLERSGLQELGWKAIFDKRMPGHRKRRQFKQTDAFTRGMVIGLKRAGWSIRQIAADTHLGASTVHRLWRRWLEQGNVAIYRNHVWIGVSFDKQWRPPQAICTAILQHVQDTLDHSISTRTISRRLVANGLHSCRPLRRLPLTPPNRRQRLEWCRARSTWMTEWHRVVFSDESRFCLSSDSRRVRVWRRRGERSNPAAIVERPTVRQCGIMVWGAIAYDSRSPLLRIQGTMTAQRHVDDVLRPVTLPYLQGVPRSEDELWQMVEREWRAIPQDAIRTLIDSLPRRVAACIAVRGGPTCY
ncbi:SMARCAL1 [Cordylochernes scorpioides]|uniref:SMARCAL1 n=1 Tax=Cordylochernes scorpioides TaxID=51811 RepID=A0ABY6JXL8_9ARAC|nr:SMARCAL1 [Cordylochernes scorpioides]